MGGSCVRGCFPEKRGLLFHSVNEGLSEIDSGFIPSTFSQLGQLFKPLVGESAQCDGEVIRVAIFCERPITLRPVRSWEAEREERVCVDDVKMGVEVVYEFVPLIRRDPGSSLTQAKNPYPLLSRNFSRLYIYI